MAWFTEGIENHHRKPHANMKIEVSNGFSQQRLLWNWQKKSSYNSIYQQNDRSYFPPGKAHGKRF